MMHRQHMYIYIVFPSYIYDILPPPSNLYTDNSTKAVHMYILKLQKVSEGRYVATFGKFLMVID